MHFGAAQRFAASIAGVKQTSIKLSAKASAGLSRRAKGYAGLWRGMVSEHGVVSCYVPSAARSFAFGELAHIEVHAALRRGMVSERGVVSCYVPRAARSFAFGELAYIEVLAFCGRALRVHFASAVA